MLLPKIKHFGPPKFFGSPNFLGWLRHWLQWTVALKVWIPQLNKMWNTPKNNLAWISSVCVVLAWPWQVNVLVQYWNYDYPCKFCRSEHFR